MGFNSCPPSYEQFVTIHGLYHGRVLPFVMALATGKRVGYYLQILQHVKVRIRYMTGHRFSPRMAICDFEQSLRIAFDTELPRTRFRNCYFHLPKSLETPSRAWSSSTIFKAQTSSVLHREGYGNCVSTSRYCTSELPTIA